MPEPHLKELWIYPLKGARGISVRQRTIDPIGLHLDRRWMLVDAETGTWEVEPMRTLATYRRYEKRIAFGQNLVPVGQGRIAVDQSVEVLERGAQRPPLDNATSTDPDP